MCDAEEFAVLGVEDQFDEAIGFTSGKGAATGAKGEFADLDQIALPLAEFLFGWRSMEANLGVRVGVQAGTCGGVVDCMSRAGRQIRST